MYAKLFSSITESSLWSEPKEVRLLFVTMLAKADQMGFIEASIPGLARVANLTIEETERGLEALQSPDKYSKNADNEGRRIMPAPGGFVLLNYEDYRARRSAEERRAYMRDYMREYRKQSVNKSKQTLAGVSRGKPGLAQAEAEAEAEAEDFDKSKSRASGSKIDPQTIADHWNAQEGTKRIHKLTAERRKKLSVRLRDPDWPWEAAIGKMPIAPIGDSGWVPTFDWLIKNESNAVKLAEGAYEPAQASKPKGPAVLTREQLKTWNPYEVVE